MVQSKHHDRNPGANRTSTGFSRSSVIVVIAAMLLLGSRLRAEWEVLNSGTTENLWGCGALGFAVDWVVGDNGTILRSTDGGESWQPFASQYTGTLNCIELRGMHYIGCNDGVFLGKNGSEWDSCPSRAYPNYILGIIPYHACGTNGWIFNHFADTWKSDCHLTSQTLYGITADDYALQHIVAVGGQGTVIRSTDGGHTWALVGGVPTTSDLFAVGPCWSTGIPDRNRVFIACGNNGTVIRSTDLGATWSVVASGTSKQLYSVALCNWHAASETTATVTIVGAQGTILNSTDWGRTWESDNCPVSADLNCISAGVQDTFTLAVGTGGVILRRLTPSSSIEERTSYDLNHARPGLWQASPNPFSDMTSIEYGVPQSCHVSLRVFGSAGALVRTLRDGSVLAGDHVATWNGRDDFGVPVGKGTYFYRLEAGEFTATRKMVKSE